jgi:hypothetical protein
LKDADANAHGTEGDGGGGGAGPGNVVASSSIDVDVDTDLIDVANPDVSAGTDTNSDVKRDANAEDKNGDLDSAERA